MDEPILVAYNSKKFRFYFLLWSFLSLIAVVIWVVMAEGTVIFASLVWLVIGISCLVAFFALNKAPDIAFEVFENRIVFYDCPMTHSYCGTVYFKEIHIVYNYVGVFGIKLYISKFDKNILVSYFISDSKHVKNELFSILKNKGIEIGKRLNSNRHP